MASLVPEPIEKCAVCAASPISTSCSWNHARLRTRTKLVHGGAAGARVGHEPVPVEPPREQRSRRPPPSAARSSRSKPGPPPRRLVALDDERRGVGVEAVAVRLEHAVRVLDEVEREGVERQAWCRARCTARCARRDRARTAGRGAARHALLTPSAATMRSASASPCRASPASSRTSVWKRSDTPYLVASPLQDLEQLLAGDAGEAVAARGDDPVAHVDVDVVPVREARP